MANSEVDPAVAIARIDESLKAVRQQMDFSDRNAAQLVRLVEEKVTQQFMAVGARFDHLERQLEDMDRAREIARRDTQNEIKDLADATNTRLLKVEGRLTDVEKVNAKILGGIVLAGFLSSGITVAVMQVVVGG